jgi:hypothetical protein
MTKAYDNNLFLLRAFVKLSSVITDIDDLQNLPKYGKITKKELNIFQDWVEDYMKGPLNSFGKVDLPTLHRLIVTFDNVDTFIVIKGKYNTKINLVYAKLMSALNDLNQLEPEYRNNVYRLIDKLTWFKSAKFIVAQTVFIDIEGNTIQNVVKMLDDMGMKILFDPMTKN